MKRRFLYCAVLALAAGSLPPVGRTQPAVTQDARHWLERMLNSTQTLSYEGTFIYVQGPHVEAMRIIHGGGTGSERQRLISLSGPPREILVANNNVVCLSPKRQATFAGGDYRRSPFPWSIPRELGQVENHYELQVLGEDRVAGLEAQVIAIKPRDAWRFGYRLWLDRRNGLALRSALLDEQGQPVEQLMFTDLQIKPQIDDDAFATPPEAKIGATPEAGSDASGAQAAAGEPVTQSAWRVEQLPEGFVQMSHNRFTEPSGRHPTEHLVFADGLATISVFLERLEDNPPLLQGSSQLGSMNAFGTVVDGHQVLVVGEAPAATVRRIATAIQYTPKAGKP
ncbi:MAG: MucB/RseB C-terminal domain-containing protein [Candidatus Contendobacter sp.]|nr:MucB/RseB C-terminal domain-containing protein [Candidatus Contendobacter sp.]